MSKLLGRGHFVPDHDSFSPKGGPVQFAGKKKMQRVTKNMTLKGNEFQDSPR